MFYNRDLFGLFSIICTEDSGLSRRERVTNEEKKRRRGQNRRNRPFIATGLINEITKI